jgi:hypothetical protein
MDTQRHSSDFELKPMVEIFGHFDRIRCGVVTELVLQGGLPVHMAVEETSTIPGDDSASEGFAS